MTAPLALWWASSLMVVAAELVRRGRRRREGRATRAGDVLLSLGDVALGMLWGLAVLGLAASEPTVWQLSLPLALSFSIARTIELFPRREAAQQEVVPPADGRPAEPSSNR